MRGLSQDAVRRLTSEPARLACDMQDSVAWPVPDGVDGQTADYILSVRDGFEMLGDVLRTTAALLILEASGARVAGDHPALRQARADFAEADAIVRSGRPTRRAMHFHSHLVRCTDRLGTVFACLADRDRDSRRMLGLLHEASDHLRRAARVLPGFEVVALGEGCGCCAARLGT